MQMKKLAAIFLALVMVLSVASLSAFADTTDATPSITVVGNESATPGTDITFDVKLENFSSVAGMDITITGTDGVEFKNITSDDMTLTKGDNCTVSANKIQIVELNEAVSSLTLKVTATVKGNADISVSAKLAANAKEFVKNFSITDGKLTTVAVTEVMGAGVRNRKETDPYALRFGMKASCTGAEYSSKDTYEVNYSSAKVMINGVEQRVARIGAIVAVTAKAGDTELTAENATTNFIKNVAANKAYDITADTVSYVVAITDIPTKAVSNTITVRPYVAYYDKNDNNALRYAYGIAKTSCVRDVLPNG